MAKNKLKRRKAKQARQQEKKQQRIKRLMARLTAMNAEVPMEPDRYRAWHRQRANIIHQLKKHGVEVEG